MTEALGLAQEKIESLEFATYANLPTYAITESNLGPSPGSAVQQLYTRTTTVTVGASSTTIQVAVSWPDSYIALRTHSVSVYEVRTP